MILKKLAAVAAAGAVSLSAASANTIAMGDLGDVTQGLETGGTLISGEVLLFTFSFGEVGDFFEITTNGSNPLSGVDTEIGLYDSLGNFVASNDDSGGVLDSLLSFGTGSGIDFGGGDFGDGDDGAIPAPGEFTLAIGVFNTLFGDTLNDITAGTGNGGDFLVSFITDADAAVVPLPAAFPLFLAGLAGLGVARRKKSA